MRWTAKAREEDYEALADIFERSTTLKGININQITVMAQRTISPNDNLETLL